MHLPRDPQQANSQPADPDVIARQVSVDCRKFSLCDVQLDATEQLELWGLLANMLAVDELVPGQLLGHVERAVAAGQQRLMRYHRPR